MEFNERIKELRIKEGYSVSDFAAKLKIADSELYNIENGTTLPSIFMLPALAGLLNVSIEYLITGSNDNKSLSKLQRGCKDDDIELIKKINNDLLNFKDEDNKTIFTYIIKYSSKNVFNYILEAYSINDLINKDKCDYLGFYGALIAFDRLDILERLRFFIDIAKDPLAIFSKTSLNIYSDEGLKVFVDNVKPLGLCYNKAFTLHENDMINPKGSWLDLYNRSLYYALIDNNEALALSLISLIIKINNKSLDMYLANDNNSNIYTSRHKLVAIPSDTYERDTRAYGVICLEGRVIEALLNKGYLDEALSLYSFNKRLDINLVPTGLFDECRLKKEGETNKNKLFVASCIDNGLINIDKLIKSNNYYLIKNALYSYPIEVDEIQDNSNATEINSRYLKGFTAAEARSNLLNELYPRLINKKTDQFSYEYFNSLLMDNNTDMLVIKLAVFLEGILKNRLGYEGTFEEMINSYLDTINNDRVGELFHKLRKERNSAVHADRTGMKLTSDELKYLIDYIIKLDK